MGVVNTDSSLEGLLSLGARDIANKGATAAVVVSEAEGPLLEVHAAVSKREFKVPKGVILLSCKKHISGTAFVGGEIMGLSCAKGKVLVGGLDIEVSRHMVLVVLLGVDQVSMGKYGDLGVHIVEYGSKCGCSLLIHILEVVRDVKGDIRPHACFRSNGLLPESEMGNKGLWLHLDLDSVSLKGSINLGLCGHFREGDHPILERWRNIGSDFNGSGLCSKLANLCKKAICMPVVIKEATGAVTSEVSDSECCCLWDLYVGSHCLIIDYKNWDI